MPVQSDNSASVKVPNPDGNQSSRNSSSRNGESTPALRKICQAAFGACYLATHQHPGAIFHVMGLDGLECSRGVGLWLDLIVRAAYRRFIRAYFYFSARLRPRGDVQEKGVERLGRARARRLHDDAL